MATAQVHRVDPAARVEEAANQLRDAITRRDYQGIDSRIVAYCDAARDRLLALDGQDERRRTALTQTLELLRWAHSMLCVGRAAFGGRLKRAAFAGRFLGFQDPHVPEFRFDL